MPSLPGTTRSRIAVGAVVALALVGAGAAVMFYSPESGDPLDSVPREVDYVGTLDPGPMHAEGEVAETTRRSLRFQQRVDFYDGPPFPRSFAVRADSPLDPGAVASVTYFGRTNGSTYDARVVRAGWTAADLVAAVEARHDVTLSPGEYRGRFFHEGDGRAVAVLANGTYAVGNATAVRDAVDVAAGEADPVEGPLRREFAATGDGYVRFAYRFRPSNVPPYPFVGESVRRLEYVAGSYYRNDSAIGVTTNLTAEDEEGARGVEGIMNAGITFYRVETGNATLRAELERIEIERVGRELRVRYESSPARYRVLIRGLIRNEPEPEES